MGVSDGLLLGCGGTPVRAAAAVKAPPAPVVGSAGRGTTSGGGVSKPKVKGPNSLNCVTPIHRSDVNFDPGAVRFPISEKGAFAEMTKFVGANRLTSNATLVCQSTSLGAFVSGSVSDCHAFFADGHSAPVTVFGVAAGVGAGAYSSLTVSQVKGSKASDIGGPGFNFVADASIGVGAEMAVDLSNGNVSAGPALGGKLYGGLQVTWTIPKTEPCGYGGPTCFGSTVSAFPSRSE
jgi:hypothetical protein